MRIILATALLLLGASPALAEEQSTVQFSTDLKAAMAQVEVESIKAQFPRYVIVNTVLKTIWRAFYDGETALPFERAVINIIAKDPTLSPLQQECIARMQAELS